VTMPIASARDHSSTLRDCSYYSRSRADSQVAIAQGGAPRRSPNSSRCPACPINRSSGWVIPCGDPATDKDRAAVTRDPPAPMPLIRRVQDRTITVYVKQTNTVWGDPNADVGGRDAAHFQKAQLCHRHGIGHPRGDAIHWLRMHPDEGPYAQNMRRRFPCLSPTERDRAMYAACRWAALKQMLGKTESAGPGCTEYGRGPRQDAPVPSPPAVARPGLAGRGLLGRLLEGGSVRTIPPIPRPIVTALGRMGAEWSCSEATPAAKREQHGRIDPHPCANTRI
jgi:hypothetical protein